MEVTSSHRPISSDDGDHHDEGLPETEQVDKSIHACSVDDSNQTSHAEPTLETVVATDLEKLSIVNAKLDENLINVITTHPILHDYLFHHSTEYRENTLLKNQGWANMEADLHFMMLREKSDNVDPYTQEVFYNQMCQIGNDMNKEHNLSLELELTDEHPKFLDLCMAPGGFSGTILDNTRNSSVCGISLPFGKGGHPLCIRGWETRKEISVHWLDITMLAAEIGVTDIPHDHPDFSEFLTLRPFENQEFGLVFCDGNVLRVHVRADYREKRERIRLLTSQLVLAFQRIKEGGTLVCRLHKIEGIETVTMLRLFSKFSSVSVFKPLRIHGARSSFYMIAKDLHPRHPEAVKAVDDWKRQWKEATLNTEVIEAQPLFDNDDPIRIETAKDIVKEFGPQLIELATPIWRIQSDGMRNKPFNTGKETRFQTERPRHHVTPSSPPSSRFSPWAKDDWRSTPGRSEAKISSTTPPEKSGRYLVPQHRRGSFMDGDPRSAHKTEPRGSSAAYGGPPNSRAWNGNWRNTMTTECKDEPKTSSTPGITPSIETLRRSTATGDRPAVRGLGNPGGNLISITNMKIETASTTDQSRRHENRESFTNKQSTTADLNTTDRFKAGDTPLAHKPVKIVSEGLETLEKSTTMTSLPGPPSLVPDTSVSDTSVPIFDPETRMVLQSNKQSSLPSRGADTKPS
ncbi:hypothetical protein SUNI508_12871 [Seiridium unicorne]|uniref:Ribosomal RNA methyltransferase FtsJ domain-containing protein n=1 Tax=Seiridium unicorne TaxID=138068 RepID=A0ABR2VGB2_9PEZI